jgi:hypothetical protein
MEPGVDLRLPVAPTRAAAWDAQTPVGLRQADTTLEYEEPVVYERALVCCSCELSLLGAVKGLVYCAFLALWLPCMLVAYVTLVPFTAPLAHCCGGLIRRRLYKDNDTAEFNIALLGCCWPYYMLQYVKRSLWARTFNM